MSKFFRKMILLLFVAFLGSTSFGLSYFYFSNPQSVKNNIDHNSLKIDDIEENYDFGKSTSDKEGKTYTIYFFPSAAYLHLYSLYLLDSDTTTDGYNISKTSTKPEDQFGYKEPTYNEDGSLATDSNGNVIYKLSENTGKYASENGISESLTYDGGYRKFNGERFSCTMFEADGGRAYGTYNSSTEWPNETVTGDPYTAKSAYSQSQDYLNNNSKFKRTWGLPSENEDFTIFNEESSNNYIDPDRVEHFNGRNQYSLDRLGSWGECYYYGYTMRDNDDDAFEGPSSLIYGESSSSETNSAKAMDSTNTGRYIPIKLTVTNELISSVVEKVIPSIFTSMGTLLRDTNLSYRYMHNYTFTEWTYVKNPDTKKSQDSSDYPYSPKRNTEEYGENTIGGAFQPVPTDTYFDMLDDLDKYADSEGVIRLFPLFSNGKKSSVSSTDSGNYTKGGGSTQRLTITHSSSSTASSSTSSNSDVEYKYPFFNTDVYTYSNKDCFTYKNENDEEVSNELLKSEYIRLFSFNNIKINSSNITELEFSANNVIDKPTGWLYDTDSTTSRTSLQWKKLYVLDQEYIQDELISKYGEGLYTFYVFVANYSYQNGPTSSTPDSDSIKTGSEAAYNVFYSNVISQAMEGKFSSLTGKRLIEISDSKISDEMKQGTKPYICSPTVIAFEKIDEPTLTISSNSSSVRNFYRNINPLYKGVKNSDSDTYSIEGDDLTSTSPYTYLVKNVDLTQAGASFEIEINNSSSSNSSINTTNDDIEYDYLISNPGNTTNIKIDDVFIKPFGDSGFIEVSTTKTASTFTIKDNCYDIYDILIKYNTNNGNYDIYMKRHDKLFCYVFSEDLTGYNADGFINHSFSLDSSTNTYKASGTSSSTLIFDREYAEGHVLDSGDKSSTANENYTLDECLRYYIGKSYTYSDDSLLNYRLIDRITGEVVAYYEKTSDDSSNVTYTLNCNLTLNKNYILILQSI